MILNYKNTSVYLFRNFVDMRKGHHGLCSLVIQEIKLNPLSGAVFLFVSKDRKSAKAIVWDGTGLILVHKKMERTKIMPFKDLDFVHEITMAEMAMILAGSKLKIANTPKRIEIDMSKHLE